MLAYSTADRESPSSNQTLAKQISLNTQKKKENSEAPLDQGVNWYRARGHFSIYVARSTAAHKQKNYQKTKVQISKYFQ